MLISLDPVALGHGIHGVVIKDYVGRMTLRYFAFRLRMLLDHYQSTTIYATPVTSAARRLYEVKASLVHSRVGFLGGTGASCGACSC